MEGPWGHSRQLCSHPCGVSMVIKPKCVLKSGCLSFTFSCLQPHHCEGKELPPKFLCLACSCWSNVSTPSRCQRSLTTSHCISYLPRLKGKSMAHFPSPIKMIHKATELKDLEVFSVPREEGNSTTTRNKLQETGSKHKLATIQGMENERGYKMQKNSRRVSLRMRPL